MNATGVFADQVRRLDEPGAAPMLAPSQGAHLVLDRRFLPGDTAILIPHTDDGRVLFAIPWLDRVIVGTTDTPVASTSLEPRPLREELDFLLSHARRYLASDPQPADVRCVFAGLRPLIAVGGRGTDTDGQPLARVRRAGVAIPGLVTITGGKWTTYRRMAETAVDLAATVGGLPGRPCETADLRLHGWRPEPGDGPFSGYGADAEALARLIRERPALGRTAPREPAPTRGGGRLGRARGSGPVGRGRPRAADPGALPRRKGEHRGRATGLRAARRGAGTRWPLGRGAGGGVPRNGDRLPVSALIDQDQNESWLINSPSSRWPRCW